MASSSKQVLRGLGIVNKQQRIYVRGIATTSTRALPRILPRRIATSNDVVVERLEREKSIKFDEETPWYIREQELFDDEESKSDQTTSTQPINPSDLEPEVELPVALQGLHELLQQGPPSPLIARPDEGPYESETGRRPIKYIHAKANDVQAWCDWIIVVQVRSSAGSTVSRVAKEIGEYLSDQKPPMDESTIAAAAAAAAAQKMSKTCTQSQKNWQPFKILSREAQEGLRILHENDPEKWTRKKLAETFKMSVESVRRILRSKWQPSPAIKSRQNRRANERYEERQQQFGWQGREEEEVERIKQSMLESNQETKTLVDEFNYDDYRVVDEEGSPIDEQKSFKQQITYEGLVPSANDPKGGQSSRSSSRARSGLLRGDGEWCLVDAGWCVVHVMTPKARITYDVESQYNSNSF